MDGGWQQLSSSSSTGTGGGGGGENSRWGKFDSRG
jgi:hypothetical protein